MNAGEHRVRTRARTHVVRTFLVSVLSVPIALGAAGAAHAAFPGKNGLIAASVTVNPTDEPNIQEDIWLFNKKGKVVKKLTNDAADDGEPSFSPNGRWIVWEREVDGQPSQIWKMTAKGKKKKQLTSLDRDSGAPSYSANGKKIVFDRDGVIDGIHVWMMNSNGGAQKQLTTTGFDIFDSDPVFFPNGKKILFESDRNDALNGYDDDELMTMKADGSNQRFLTQNETSDSDPNFAPNGKRIIYDGDDSLVRSKVNGNAVVTLIDENEAGIEVDDPVYSPDGKKIAVDGDLDDVEDPERLYVANADGTGLKAKTPTNIAVEQVDWGVKVKKKGKKGKK